MLDSYPRDLGRVDREALVRCIDACLECLQVCTACADACLGEDTVAELGPCVRADLDCADVCAATARVLSRHTGDGTVLATELLEACATAAKACGDECAGHAEMHEHCRICAEVCRRCERACQDLLASLVAGSGSLSSG